MNQLKTYSSLKLVIVNPESRSWNNENSIIRCVNCELTEILHYFHFHNVKQVISITIILTGKYLQRHDYYHQTKFLLNETLLPMSSSTKLNKEMENLQYVVKQVSDIITLMLTLCKEIVLILD